MCDWSCDGKLRYSDRGQADAVICRMRKRAKLKSRNEGKLDAYACRTCGGWHIGHNRRAR